MNISEGLEPDCMRRWRFLKQESSELERLSADLDWCEEQITAFLGEKLYQSFSALEWFKKWDEPDVLKRQFCLEFLDASHPPQYASDKLAVTEHFILVTGGFHLLERLYLASYFRNLEYRKGIYTYYFRDLTSFALEEDYREDMALVKKAIQKFGLVVRARRL